MLHVKPVKPVLGLMFQCSWALRFWRDTSSRGSNVKKVHSDMCAPRRFKSACASACRKFASLAIQTAPSEDSDQTSRM